MLQLIVDQGKIINYFIAHDCVLVANDGSELKIINGAFQRSIVVYFVVGGIINGNMSRVQPSDAGSMALMERVL